MFHKWGFLLTEIWGLLALAALLGLFVGWLIWGRASKVTIDTSEADRLRADLSACNAKGKDLAARLATAEAQARDASARADAAAAKAAAATVGAATAAAATPAPLAAMAAPVMSAPVAKAEPAKEPAPKAAPAKAEAVPAAASGAAAKPKGLTAARDGKADDLKMIKGIGPALEKLCNKLGFYHFDQLAAWTASEIAWVDENLEGFKGRVTRDEWVRQANVLAKGGTTEFSKRVKEGDVY